ncbi:MAG TPA: hypothetical protein DEP48_00510 [Persephonella sp.]|nr:hypothetical protein [Persephonella sp.]
MILTFGTSFSLTAEDAERIIKEYIEGSSYTSKINICENEKYFIGEVFLEGYEGKTVIRKVFVNKETGGIYPTMAEAYNHCYMMEK